MSRGGFISSTVAPVQRKRESRFGLMDGAVIAAFLLGLAAVAVFLAI